MVLLSIDWTNLHELLRSLYDEMMPLCEDMASVAKGVAGIGALFYVAYRVWQSLSRAEEIDVFPLFRPFVLGLCIMFFPTMVLGTINGILSPVCSATSSLVEQQTFDMKKYQEEKDELEREAMLRDPAKAFLVSDEEFDKKIDELGWSLGDMDTMINMYGQKAVYDMGEKVTASHTTAMHSYNNAYASRLFRLLKMSKIHFVANPLVNIHLQGRFDTYPKRRGVTRVKEMLKNNINVCFGHDDVFDPWYPLGIANMLQVLHMGLHVCQLMGYGQINDGLKLVTENSAKALGLIDYGIQEGNSANFIVLPAENGFDAVRRQVPTRYSIRHGKVISETQLAKTTIHLSDSEQVNYR